MAEPTQDPAAETEPAEPAPPDPGASLAERLLASPELADSWTELRLEAGEVLFQQGDPGDAFYVVQEGELDVLTSDDILLERMGPGASLGEISLLDGGTRAAGAVARTPLRLNRLGRDDFLESLPTSPILSQTVIDILQTRVRRNAQYLGYLSSWARLVAHGDYDGAREAVHEQAADNEDANLSLFVGTFTGMVDSLQAREAELKRELMQLRIAIDRKEQAEQVTEITEDDYFRSLQARGDELRNRIKGEDG